MAAFGLTESWWCLMALPACALIGLTFASIGFVGTTYMRGWTDMDIVNTLMMPLFLFSATFFPIVVVRPIGRGWCSSRRCTTAWRWCGPCNAGVWTASLVVHALVLLVISVVMLAWASRRIDRLLRR